MGGPNSIKMKWVCLHNLEIQGENYASKYAFLRRVEIEQKPIALLGLMLLQPWMQK